MANFINIAIVNILWFVIIISAREGVPVIGFTATLLSVLGHVLLSKNSKRTAVFILVAAGLGAVVDSLFLNVGVVQLSAQSQNSLLSQAPQIELGSALTLTMGPLFMMSFWVNYASSFDLSMNWVTKRVGLAAVLHGIFGPMAYLGGVRFNVISIPDPQLLSLGILGVIWAMAGVFLALAYRYLESSIDTN